MEGLKNESSLSSMVYLIRRSVKPESVCGRNSLSGKEWIIWLNLFYHMYGDEQLIFRFFFHIRFSVRCKDRATRFRLKVPLPTRSLRSHSICDRVGNFIVDFVTKNRVKTMFFNPPKSLKSHPTRDTFHLSFCVVPRVALSLVRWSSILS